MSSQYVDELLVSLKELYKTSAYSDLIIQCGDDKHKVHKAVVLPRSKRLADMLSNGPPERYDYEALTLNDDDPQAFSLMLHYLYHLDYPDIQVNKKQEANAHQVLQANSNPDSNHSKNQNESVEKNHHPAADITNGLNHSTIKHSIEKELLTDPTTASSPTGTGETSSEAGPKKSKKKKRRNTPVEPLSESAATSPSAVTKAPSEVEVQHPSSSSSSTTKVPAPVPATTTTTTVATTQKLKHQSPTTATTAPDPAPVTLAAPSGSNTGSLTIHAQLYALSTKYGVAGLAALAADRFERGVGRGWATDEFLRAAREAYTSTDRADRRLRDAVLGAVQAHPELLARAPVQDAIRGLELSFDLLMRMRGEGGVNGVAAAVGAGVAVV